MYSLERGDHVGEREVLVMIAVQGVAARLHAGAARVVSGVEAQLQVLGERQRPRTRGQRHDGRHLTNETENNPTARLSTHHSTTEHTPQHVVVRRIQVSSFGHKSKWRDLGGKPELTFIKNLFGGRFSGEGRGGAGREKSDLLAFLAPAPGQDRVLEARDRRLQVLHVNVHGARAVSKVAHVVHHRHVAVGAGTDVRRPAAKRTHDQLERTINWDK